MKNKTIPVLIVLAIAGTALWFTVGSPLLQKYTPTKEMKDLNLYYDLTAEDQSAIILNEEKISELALVRDGETYVSYSFVHETLNSRFHYDYNENLLHYAFDTELFTAEPDEIYKDHSSHPLVILSEGEAYINIAFLQKYSDFVYTAYENPNRIVITNQWDRRELAHPTKDTEIRTLGGIKSPILKNVIVTDQLTVLARDEKWTKVATTDGMIGYIRSNKISEGSEEIPVSPYTEESHEHILLDEKICLAWHQISNPDANKSIEKDLKSLKGVNVISPTWFYVSDEEGKISDNASEEYVKICHKAGVQVWPTINDVDFPEVDIDAVMSHTSARSNLIDQLMEAADKLKFDGINVDLERTSANGSGSSYIEFIRELSIRCAEKNLILSIDNTRPYSFNQYYDRAEQAKFADYLIFMAYDQHYNGSEDGSVADLLWVEEGVIDTLAQDVPKEQLLLGCPFYTRVWEVTPKADATGSDDRLENYDITSTIYTMGQAQKLVSDKKASSEWLEDLGQNYAEWEEDGTTCEVWLEDTDSIKARLELMDNYELAGAAFWKLGLESADAWTAVEDFFK